MIDLRPDQFEAKIRQAQFRRDRREIGQLKSERVHVRPKPGERDLLGRRHAADGMVLIDDERPQARPRQVAGAGQAVVAGPDDDRVIELRHI